MKTLVITHTSALRDQWVEEVEKLYGIKPGVIGGGKFDSNAPIVVGNIQSLVKNMDHIAKGYGTIIMDEAHHTPATTFTNLINECHARYRIALSGTMTRKDGKHILFTDYFGTKVFKPPQNNTMNPTIRLLKTGIKLPQAATWADKVTKLLADEEYQDLIASMALVQARKGHKVLVIADRVDFLQKVAGMLDGRSALVVGETVDRKAEIQKIENGECDILCGSRQIFSEGISVNVLSCVILAIPITNPATLEQIIGRVMRQAPGKLDPIVLDLQFAGPTEKRQNSTRIGFYLEKGWNIEQL
jgi:superfamily II DNA or RNA helicase